MNRKLSGICKLTGDEGRFVKAHIIPKALTKLSRTGEVYLQAGSGGLITRRRDSWYDTRILTQKGENVMTEYDTQGIEYLRKHSLVWSGWCESSELKVSGHTRIDDIHGIREIADIDTQLLRLFLLSVLWRAASSEMYEFAEITLPKESLARLAAILLKTEPDDPTFLPIGLVQLSTKGPPHNHSPIASSLEMPSFEDQPQCTVDIFRFYFDGLIVHFHRPSPRSNYSAMGPLALGMEQRAVLPTVTYEGSLQLKNMKLILEEAYPPYA